MKKSKPQRLLAKLMSVIMIFAMAFAFTAGSMLLDYDDSSVYAASSTKETRKNAAQDLAKIFGYKYKTSSIYFSVGKSPSNKVSNQQAAKIMCKILDLEPASKCNITFKDRSKISTKYKGYVYALVNEGYMSGDSKYFKPTTKMTKKQFSKLLTQVTGKKITKDTEDKKISGNALIAEEGITLKNVDIVGNLIIAEGVDEGKITLDNVSVSGKTIIRGGEEITVKNESLLSQVNVENYSGKTTLSVSDDSFAENVEVARYGGTVTLAGNYGDVSVTCQSGVILKSASVKSLDIAKSAAVSVDGSSYVAKAMLNAAGVQLIGVGMVGEVEVNANDAEILTSKTKVTVSKDVTGTKVAGKAVSAGESLTSPDNTEKVNSSYTYTKTEITTEIDWDALTQQKPNTEEDKGTITVYFAADDFILGTDNFIVEPVKLTVAYGETAAVAITKALADKGFSYSYSGSIDSDFYLSSVNKVMGYAPKTLTLDTLPSCLQTKLNTLGYTAENGTNPFFDGTQNKGSLADSDKLGEMDYTSMSGWMYSVNGTYPNVGMSNFTLSDGDVIRLTYTLWGWGADIGGGYAAGGAGTTNYYDYNFLTDDIKKVADGTENLASLVTAAKKITK